ncbi:MAG: membrane protein insertase YidC [Proteobacteria bacterium]|nr:membrane protein insertase YidC [Pseudomonadota bacterium]MBU1639818.1 membrane protein insertase YidC [Pseudomonadota bacterium]
MDNQRVLLAVVLSLAILLGYNYFFVPPRPLPTTSLQDSGTETARVTPDGAFMPKAGKTPGQASISAPTVTVIPGREGRDIHVETSLYQAVISENGGGVKSFKLKKYNEQLDPASGPKELNKQKNFNDFPLYFSWGDEPSSATIPVFEADKTELTLGTGDSATLTMRAMLPSGVVMSRVMTFRDDSYEIGLDVTVFNSSQEDQVQGANFLRLVNEPFSKNDNERFVFTGPTLFQNNALEQIKVDDLEDGAQERAGNLEWIAYEGVYFMEAVIPDGDKHTAHFQLLDGRRVSSTLSAGVVAITPQADKTYSYKVFFGPKKLTILNDVGHNLNKAVNFGWFDVLAKPMLFLLNFLYGYIHNYGVGIILVTVIIKLLFWPISFKGMKSMKTMQKLQPKMTQIREKYGNDRDRMNREIMQLYKTYKVSPLGGCLPMLLQIPVFFALYRLLMQTIELRHAPFFGWITDLSAPDRLFIGFDIPYLGGLPVLTLFMGASMFLQQKMTPAQGDPNMAKMMMFLPVVFTFMFINFASGLVLYWFVNNLLSIAQQYAINKVPDL